MNKIIIYIGLLLFMIVTSCSDFLNTESSSKFEPEYVFNSVDDVFVAVTGVYSVFTNDALYNSRISRSYVQSTDVEFMPTGNPDGLFSNFTPASNNTDIQNTWRFFYLGISRANLIIEGIEKSVLWRNQTDKTVSSDLSQLLGEAKALRAMMYLDMTRIWGDVPFITWATEHDEKFENESTDRSLIWEWLIDDLIETEPTMQYASEIKYGVERASREFCQGLISLIAMNRGGWYLRPWDGNEPAGVEGSPDIGYMYRHDDYLDYYKIAREYSKKVWDDNRHSLTYSYKKLWYEITNDRYPVADDVIFAIPLSGGEFAYSIGVPIQAGTHPYGGAGGGLSTSIVYYTSFDGQDLRRDVTCVPFRYNEGLNQNINVGMALQCGKWNRLLIESPLGSQSTKSSGINYIFMRYADVLLLFAEAENELNGPTEDAKMALKMVRQRAFDVDNWSIKVEDYVESLTTQEVFFQAIMDERRWEFGGEQQRKWDLARWNKYGQAVFDTYYEFMGWGKYVAGVGGNEYIDKVREKIWWRTFNDPDNPGRKILDIWGLETQEYVRPQENYEEWTEVVVVGSWWRESNSVGEQLHNNLRGAFAGYINPSNEDVVDPLIHPVRYLFPIPNSAISDSKGLLKNYYGY